MQSRWISKVKSVIWFFKYKNLFLYKILIYK